MLERIVYSASRTFFGRFLADENSAVNTANGGAGLRSKGAITSKIKHAVKYKTSPARLAQLLQPSLAFCFSLQPMTAYTPSLAASEKQNANEGCNSCASLAGLVLSFIACFILLVITPLGASGSRVLVCLC